MALPRCKTWNLSSPDFPGCWSDDGFQSPNRKTPKYAFGCCSATGNFHHLFRSYSLGLYLTPGGFHRDHGWSRWTYSNFLSFQACTGAIGTYCHCSIFLYGASAHYSATNYACPHYEKRAQRSYGAAATCEQNRTDLVPDFGGFTNIPFGAFSCSFDWLPDAGELVPGVWCCGSSLQNSTKRTYQHSNYLFGNHSRGHSQCPAFFKRRHPEDYPSGINCLFL